MGWIPEPPPLSLQLVNMKLRAGGSWPLNCQQSAHLESRKAFLGAPRSGAQGCPTPPSQAVASSLVGAGLLLPEPHSNHQSLLTPFLLSPSAVP